MLLRCNLLLNGLADKVTVVERALSDTSGRRLMLEVHDHNHGDNRIASDLTQNSIEVQSITLDEIAETCGSSQFLVWMDLQGYEGIALQGFKKGLQRKPPLAIEFGPDVMARHNTYAGLKEAIGHYTTFVDLAAPQVPRKMGDLDDFFNEVRQSPAGYSDILLIR